MQNWRSWAVTRSRCPILLFSRLCPLSYHLFQSLKAFLAKKIFAKFEEVEQAASGFFEAQFLLSKVSMMWPHLPSGVYCLLKKSVAPSLPRRRLA